MTARAVTALPAVLLAALLVALLPAPPARGTGAAADFDLAKLNEGGYVVLLRHVTAGGSDADDFDLADCRTQRQVGASGRAQAAELAARFKSAGVRSEEHTSELQSLMRISYAVFRLEKKT